LSLLGKADGRHPTIYRERLLPRTGSTVGTQRHCYDMVVLRNRVRAALMESTRLRNRDKCTPPTGRDTG